MEKIKGISLLDDILFGKCIYFKQRGLSGKATTARNVGAELKKLEKALKLASQQLKNAYSSNLNSIGQENAMIFKAQELILNDSSFLEKIKETINLQECNAEYAVFAASEYFANSLNKTGNEYIQARVNDIKEVSLLLVNSMCCKNSAASTAFWAAGVAPNPGSANCEHLIVSASDIFVSDIIAFKQFGVKGFISKNGCITSHSSILAQSLGLTALVGVGRNLDGLSGEEVILSGKESIAIISPDEKTKKLYLKKQQADKTDISHSKFYKSQTQDGVEIELMVNINSLDELKVANESGAEGVGLFRSEYLFIGKERPPSEEDQYAVYKQLLLDCKEKLVNVRTLDIGFDKVPEYYKDKLPWPAILGERGIRFCLKHQDIFKQQLRALLRASIYGNLSIILPMVSTTSEVLKTKKLINNIKTELKAEGLPFNQKVPLGVMIETPAAVIEAPQLAKLVDFFSLGTNDLVQLTFAVDRSSNEAQNAILSSGVLHKMIKIVARVAQENGKPLSVCGACAGETDFLGDLIGLGIKRLSVNPRQLLNIKNQLKKISFAKESKRVNEVIGNEFQAF